MTAPGGHRPEHLARFAALTEHVQRAIARRHLEDAAGRRWIAAECGVDKAHIWAIWTGRSIPSVTLVAKLADVLHAPDLIRTSNAIRTKACAICGQPYLDSTGELKRLYCGDSCHKTALSRQRRGSHLESIAITRRMLERHRDAVGKFCRACACDSVCPDAECVLRPVSPLPLPRGQQWAEVRKRATWLREGVA
jgi:hypothetical protein